MSLPVKVTRETLQKMPNLRAIHSYSAGVDRLDYASVPRDVRVCSNAGGFTQRVARAENEDFETPLWDLENIAGTLHSAVLGRDDALAEADVMAAQNPPSSPIA